MKISDLIIDPRSLGSKLWLVDVTPAYEYKDNRRTDTVSGYKYVICMPDKNYEKIGIKVDGKQLMEKPKEGYTEVCFKDLELFVYWSNNQPVVAARASGISLANNKA